MAGNNMGKRRKKKRGALFAPLSFIVICAALVFGLSVFFKVSKIEVTGASSYTEQEIIDASGVELGDNLFFVNRFTAASRIFAKLPYVDQVNVNRSLPNKIVIEVTESAALAYVPLTGDYWIVDDNCKLLEKRPMSELGSLISVAGITPMAPTLGETLMGSGSDAGKVAYLSDLLKALRQWNMCADVTKIDMSNVASPEFDYLGRFTVKLGQYENVGYKIELLLSAVDMLAEGDSGTIDLSLSSDNKAHFSPD